MSRTVAVRTVGAYERDVKTLLRLRTAMMIDNSIDDERRVAAVTHLDSLVSMIQSFAKELQASP